MYRKLLRTVLVSPKPHFFKSYFLFQGGVRPDYFTQFDDYTVTPENLVSFFIGWMITEDPHACAKTSNMFVCPHDNSRTNSDRWLKFCVLTFLHNKWQEPYWFSAFSVHGNLDYWNYVLLMKKKIENFKFDWKVSQWPKTSRTHKIFALRSNIFFANRIKLQSCQNLGRIRDDKLWSQGGTVRVF